MLIVAIYVDNFLILHNNNSIISQFKKYLCSKFKIKDIGPVNSFLGIRVSRDRKMNKLWIDQEKYANEVLEKYRMENCKPISTPLDANHNLSKDMSPQTEEEKQFMQNIPYREAIGSLLFLSQISRPDIYYAVNVLSQFNSNSGIKHWQAVKRVMRYIKGTLSSKIEYSKSNEGIFGYCDADWAGDKETRRSTSGYVFMMSNGPISWKSQKQSTVALSSCEAEYISLCTATQEANWWLQFSRELCPQENVKILCDNQSAIAIGMDKGYSSKSKHIDIKYYFVRQMIEENKIDVEYVPSEDQGADGLTKPLNKVKLQKMKNLSI